MLSQEINLIDWLLSALLKSKQNTKLYEQIQLVDCNLSASEAVLPPDYSFLGAKKNLNSSPVPTH